MDIKRVRMFCDWDNDSRQLIERLKTQSLGFEGDQYHDIEFVDHDDYDYAVGFNYVQAPRMKVRLVLEPPEIYTPQEIDDVPTYSFVDTGGVHKTAYGLGFATVPWDGKYPEWNKHPKHICMIVSNKRITPDHGVRHIIKDLLLESDLEIDFYGRGLSGSDPRIKGEIPPMEKYKILPQYKYCIDFENSYNAVTDKYFDPVLCNTIPITNSLILQQFDTVAEYVPFIGSYRSMIRKIAAITNRKPVFDPTPQTTFSRPKMEILDGKLSLAKWIRERVNE